VGMGRDVRLDEVTTTIVGPESLPAPEEAPLSSSPGPSSKVARRLIGRAGFDATMIQRARAHRHATLATLCTTDSLIRPVGAQCGPPTPVVQGLHSAS